MVKSGERWPVVITTSAIFDFSEQVTCSPSDLWIWLEIAALIKNLKSRTLSNKWRVIFLLVFFHEIVTFNQRKSPNFNQVGGASQQSKKTPLKRRIIDTFRRQSKNVKQELCWTTDAPHFDGLIRSIATFVQLHLLVTSTTQSLMQQLKMVGGGNASLIKNVKKELCWKNNSQHLSSSVQSIARWNQVDWLN